MKPDYIRILGINYKVLFEDSEDTGLDAIGKVNQLRCIIKICNNLNGEQHQKSVVLHEIIEAINYRLELKLNHNVITSLEAGLIQVFLDNPQLLGYFND